MSKACKKFYALYAQKGANPFCISRKYGFIAAIPGHYLLYCVLTYANSSNTDFACGKLNSGDNGIHPKALLQGESAALSGW